MASIRASRLLRPGIALVALAALTLASASAAREQVVSARAVITGSATSYRITWTNTGDQAILCAGLLLTGVQPTSASGPAGVLTRVGTFQGRGLVHMQGNAATPVVAAGGTAAASFTTNVAIPLNAGGEIRYSATCLPGSDIVGQATGPPAPPPPPPPKKQKPCRCVSLDVELAANKSASERTRAVLDQKWTLGCTKGSGHCSGRLITELSSASKRADVDLSVVQDGVGRGRAGKWFVTCDGRCFLSRPREISGAGYIDLRPPRGQRFGPGGITSVTLEVERICRRELTTKRFLIEFNAVGAINERRSDLNGNGVADGKERKK
jgi:hypothetical protein